VPAGLGLPAPGVPILRPSSGDRTSATAPAPCLLTGDPGPPAPTVAREGRGEGLALPLPPPLPLGDCEKLLERAKGVRPRLPTRARCSCGVPPIIITATSLGEPGDEEPVRAGEPRGLPRGGGGRAATPGRPAPVALRRTLVTRTEE
jgi:hypothetical protein